MLSLDKILIIIPSLDPDDKLTLVVNSLQKVGFNNILLVDDGSVDDKKHYFQNLKEQNNCILLNHETNKGKGRALKTAFNYALENIDKFDAVITVDGDNQHNAQDVLKVAENITQNFITLGVRSFGKNNNIPWRSRAGNIASAFVFRLISGNNINDTQTGLRGIYIDNLADIVKIEGERFEYEMNVLLHLKKLHLKPLQVPIETIYINENETSHFNPVLDSIKVFKTILTFLASSFFCFFIDIAIYSFILYCLFDKQITNQNIFISTLCSRIISSVANFTINYKVVFKSSANIKVSVLKYYLLAIVQMFASSIGIMLLTFARFSPIVTKIIVDFLLFIVSYLVQKKLIFRR